MVNNRQIKEDQLKFTGDSFITQEYVSFDLDFMNIDIKI